MKTFIKYFFVALIFTGFVSTTLAKDNVHFSERDIANLVNGIESDNNGLMRSSIYFAGKYRILETTDALLEVLKNETDASNIILIALTIYEIGDRDAMMKVIETAKEASNTKVKNMLFAIALQFLAQSDVQFVVR